MKDEPGNRMELVREITNSVEDDDGRSYHARVFIVERGDGLWDGAIGFVPAQDGPVLWALRETTQPEKHDAEYWASGLTYAYLEGALERAEEAPDGVSMM